MHCTVAKQFLLGLLSILALINNAAGSPFQSPSNPAEVYDWVVWGGEQGRFQSSGHGNEWVDVRLNHIAASFLAKGQKDDSAFPEGSQIAKVFYLEKGDKFFASRQILLMEKMSAKFDEDNGNWAYGVVNRERLKPFRLKVRGKVNSCIRCHKNFKSYDYVISRSYFRQ